ncbi:hypothetical protein HY78_30365 (plasmid) [Rhizorhabdus wittichii DC-6]|nr:hypothetical protein HY78_30365 [Rhizorhabdus wittichii DC-6]
MVTIVRAGSGELGIPAGLPILFDADMAIIEPAFVWLMEHAELSGRAQASETVRTYGEHLYDWFDSLEQSRIEWREADERVIAAYRNRMLENPSTHTGRPYARTTINARVSTVCRFYAWALDQGLIDHCPFRLTEKMTLMLDGAYRPGLQRRQVNALIVSRPEKLPRPLRADELARLIYSHHASVLDALRELQSRREGTAETAATEADRARSALLEAEDRNIALATHNASLLKRAVEAEQRAERLERRNAQLVQELDRIRRPVPIRASAEAPAPSAA